MNEIEVKNNEGRPRKFQTPNEMQEAIDAYFSACDGRTIKVYDKKTETIVDLPAPMPYTVEGLCNTLEIERQTLLNYEKEPAYSEFFDTVKKAKLKIQQNHAERGLIGSSNSAVSIFIMKNNFGYEDKQSVNLKHERVIKGMSKDELIEAFADEPAE